MRPARPSTLRMFQSTHSLRSATITSRKLSQAATVSIHALLAECDSCPPGKLPPSLSFNPRTPCGVRQSLVWRRTGEAKFQSTHSLRSATLITRQPRPISYGFNPRTPCGVRPKSSRAGATSHGFQSTHSLRSATPVKHPIATMQLVSIHALLAECDECATGRPPSSLSFNPRTPCGVRRYPTKATINNRKFQSTHSLRSATPSP